MFNNKSATAKNVCSLTVVARVTRAFIIVMAAKAMEDVWNIIAENA
jgi:hypothetical protein